MTICLPRYVVGPASTEETEKHEVKLTVDVDQAHDVMKLNGVELLEDFSGVGGPLQTNDGVKRVQKRQSSANDFLPPWVNRESGHARRRLHDVRGGWEKRGTSSCDSHWCTNSGRVKSRRTAGDFNVADHLTKGIGMRSGLFIQRVGGKMMRADQTGKRTSEEAVTSRSTVDHVKDMVCQFKKGQKAYAG